MGLSFVFPFLSLLLTSRLGYSDTEAGYLVFISSLFSILGSLLGGKLADYLGRKKIYLWIVLMAIAAVILAGIYAGKTFGLIFIILVYADVSAILPVLSAMILDHSDKSKKTECYSLMYLSGNIGSSLGPIIAGYLFYSHMPWIFYSMAIAFSLTFLLILLGVRDVYVPAGKSNIQYEKKPMGTFSLIFHDPVLLIFILCISLLNMCYINLDFMLPLQFTDLFGLDTGSKCSSLVWTINGLVVVALTPAIVSFTKKLHPLFNIRIAAFLYAFGFMNYIFVRRQITFMLPVIIWTSGEILIATCAGIYIADHLPETHKGRSMSLYESSRGIGKLGGPVFSGQLLTALSYGGVWLVITLICVLVGFIVWGVYFYSAKK